MEAREIRAYSILSKGDAPIALDEEHFLIPSQSGGGKYRVSHLDGWSCECEDFKYRKKLCKHILATQYWLKLRDGADSNELMEIEKGAEAETNCPYCKSANVVRNGNRRVKVEVRQRYLCKDCKKRFVLSPIKHVKGNGKIITLAMDLYFKGLSLRDITDTIYQFYGLRLHHETIRRWIERFTKMLDDYVSKLQPKLGDTWHADEQMVKIKGKWAWNWNVLDSKTRFLIASNITKGREIRDARAVFGKTKEIASENPQEIITDGLHSYTKAIKKEFLPRRTQLTHTKLRTIKQKPNNNRIERYHSTFREFDKVRRGFKSERTAQNVSDGFRVYYNFIRPHASLGGLTPAQVSGIPMDADGNRWLNLLEATAKDGSKGISKEKFKLKLRSGTHHRYALRIFDHNGNEVNAKDNGFKSHFDDMRNASEFVDFYKSTNPNYDFRIERAVE